MLRIRLSRTGKKNQPMYRIVLAEHSRPVQAKFIEILGYYNPRSKDLEIQLDKIDEWVKKGAQTTPSVDSLIERAKDPEGFEKKRSEAREKKAKRRADKRAANKEPAADAAPKDEAKEGDEAPAKEKEADEPKEDKPAEEKAEK